MKKKIIDIARSRNHMNSLHENYAVSQDLSLKYIRRIEALYGFCSKVVVMYFISEYININTVRED
jgi:hypothetical protein